MNARALKIIVSTNLLPLLLLVLPVAAQAQFNYTVSNGAATITGYTGGGGAVTIPGTLSGSPVVGIAPDAFQFSAVTSVVIPASVTNISGEAFDGCYDMTAITVNASNPNYSSLGGVLFDKTQVTLVQYPDGLAGSYFIPDTVTNIADGAFNNCLFMTSVNIAYSVLNIGNNFINCPDLMGFTVDGLNPNYYSLNSVLVDKTHVTLVRFPGGLTGSYMVPTSVITITTNAFADSLIGVVVVPGGVATIGSYAFSGCARLTGVYFQGNAPSPANDLTVFSGDSNTLVYYPPGATGWGATFDGLTTVSAVNPPNYSDFNYLIFNDQIEITGDTNMPANGVVVIPNTINGYPVTSIGGLAFERYSTLTSITLPNSLTTSTTFAFYDCTSLTNATIGTGLTSIPNNMFEDCYLLKSVNIPANITSIGAGAFYDCVSLPRITIPGSVAGIGDDAFEYCGSLTNIIISNGVASIGNYTFWQLGANSVAIPASVTSIGESAFGNGNNLTAINVDGANPDYSSLYGVLFDKAQATLLQYPGGLVGNYAIPNGVRTIETNALDACYRLTSVYIPESVTNIEDWSFALCNLTNVVIPAGVTHIGSDAFYDNSGLSAIYFEGNSPTPNNDTTVFSSDNNPTVYYQSGTTGWSTTFDGRPNALLNLTADFNYTTFNNTVAITGYIGPAGAMIIPNKINGNPVTAIENYAFQGNSSVSSVSFFGTNLTYIGISAFAGCSHLTSVNIPNSVTIIDLEAFIGCYNLSSVSIGAGVASIGNEAFDDCYLTSITIPASVTSIGDEAFWDNQFLTSFTVAASNPNYSSLNGVLFDKAQDTLLQCPGGMSGSYTIPASVTSIGDNAFGFCYRLTNVNIPNSVTNIGDSAFTSCYGLTNVTIPAGVISIGGQAFTYSDLTSISIPANVTSIGGQAFDYNGYLTNITVAASNPDYSSLNGVLYDKAQATLLQCPGGLAGSFNIPGSVTNIGDYSFYGCYLLTGVVIPNSVTSVGTGAFLSCSDLTKVTIGAGVTNIGSYTFDGCNNLTGVYFQGNSPIPTNDSTVFSGDSQGVVYILPATTGWGTMFDGLPIATWLPQMQAGNGNSGVHSNQFGFNINWAGNQVVVVEAATNLFNPVWVPVSTNTLANGASSFSDPLWTNYPGRYYRLATQ